MEEFKNLKVNKRNNTLVNFNKEKISTAIYKASYSTTGDLKNADLISKKITNFVIEQLKNLIIDNTIDIELIQNKIEETLMKEGYTQIAKKYILYRDKRSEIRNTKSLLGIEDDLKLSINSMTVLKKRYLLKDENKNIVETPKELFKRVARHIASAEDNYASGNQKKDIEQIFYDMMTDMDFLPNSPTLMNAGTGIGQLSACFVIPVEDSIHGIFDAVKQMAIIHQSGGGTGFNFSHIRPKDDLVASTKGDASGPLSFMEVFDKSTEVIMQGGRRRGANMGILRCDHPDMINFIKAKVDNKFSNFNLSIGVTDKFMEAVLKNENFQLVNPRTGKKTKSVKANEVFQLIIDSAWHTGDPGLIFLDEINRNNPTPGIGKIEATNPCGELPLLAFESCNLGSINLSNMVDKNMVDWEKLKKTIHYGIRFLDNVIDVNKYPLTEIKEITFGNRKIGLGIMGFADMLIKCNIPYNSKEAVSFAGKLMQFIHKESIEASVKLAESRGVFPNYKKSVYYKKNIGLRNATVNTIAPTGTISIIANCSSGIEPIFGICFMRNVMSGTKMLEVNNNFEDFINDKNIDKKKIYTKILNKGSIQEIDEIPEDVKKIFVTTFDIKPEDHLKIQSTFQKHTDNSVSKTVNLPETATFDDIKNIYLKAYKLKCKGITIYRYGSKDNQVLSFDKQNTMNENMSQSMIVNSEFLEGCGRGDCLF